jgi:acyl-CoA thioester hydrolase
MEDRRPPFSHWIRVRYAETDRMGVVYHARYLEWFESARTEMLRSEGLPYIRLEESGIRLPVIEVSCIYEKAVTYDERIEIRTWISEADRVRIRLNYEVWGENDTIRRAHGSTSHCFLNAQGKPVRLPKPLMPYFNNLSK